jgi:hypothetical protein
MAESLDGANFLERPELNLSRLNGRSSDLMSNAGPLLFFTDLSIVVDEINDSRTNMGVVGDSTTMCILYLLLLATLLYSKYDLLKMISNRSHFSD